MMNSKLTTKKMILCSIFMTLATVLGTFSIPILGAKASPIQHLINVMAGVTLGPTYGVFAAFGSALLRNMLGTGSILAFPGSMIGAFLAGYLFSKSKRIELAVLGEFMGTGLLGALVAYPLASLVLGKEVAVVAYIIPFSISSGVGSVMAYMILKVKAVRLLLLEERKKSESA